MAEASTNRPRPNSKKKRRKGRTAERRNVGLLILSTLLVIGSIIMFTPPQDKIHQGLDLQGGLSVVLSASSTDGEAVSSEDMDASRDIIEQRVNALGASEATVQLQGTNQILVQIPGMSDTQEALDTIGRTGKLEFARLDSFTDQNVVSQIENGQYANAGTITDDFGNVFPSGETTHLTVEDGTYTPIITGANITDVSIGQNETGTQYTVNVSLDAEGTQAFAEATQELASSHGQIVIILDNEVQSAPAVQAVISDGNVSISGNYDMDEARQLETVLESGSLPVSFEVSQSQVVGPTLGQDALFSGLIAAAAGLIIVLLYLVFFYKGLGIIAAIMMVVFSVFYLGLLAVLSSFNLFSLSLAGIAGIVLTIGMAADASILVLERFREEIRMGRSVKAASMDGVKHGILTAIDADVVTLVSALTLFFLATASVQGFGLTLALGIACNIFSMFVLMMPLMRVLAPHTIAKHPGFWNIKDCQELVEHEQAGTLPEKPRGRFIKRDINFLGHRKTFLAIAAAMIVAAFVIVGVRGLNFGVEFQSGTSIAFNSAGDVTIEQVRDAFNEAGEPDAVVQTTVSSDGEPGYLVRTTETDASSATAVATEVASDFGWSSDSYQVSTIQASWGAGVIQSSLIALLVSFALIIAYIAVRFEYKMGLTAIAALIHDIIIVVGIYALVGREVTPNAVAALLTILGYSLYDKVVVFHRINENMKGDQPRCTFMTMANRSINQVIIRSVNTSLTSLIPVVAMLLFGGETLKDFAFAMAIGLVCGAYSTISVATPLYAIWKTHEEKYASLVKKYGPEVERCFLGYLPSDKRLAEFTANRDTASADGAADVEPAADTAIDASEGGSSKAGGGEGKDTQTPSSTTPKPVGKQTGGRKRAAKKGRGSRR